jgi:hypothetical protein
VAKSKARQIIAPVTLHVQKVIDMLERDKCPASVGGFFHPNSEDMGLLMVLVKPEYADRTKAFIQTLYDEAGYVSPVYDEQGKEVLGGS